MTLQERLDIENQILRQDGMPQFLIKYSQDSGFYFIYGEQNSNSGRNYTIWCRIPDNYPNVCPPVYIYKPNPLVGYGGKNINSYGVSHSMHTLAPSDSGEVQICHWRQSSWHSGITLNKVMIKVILWLEAYEQHLQTGKPINDYVLTMK